METLNSQSTKKYDAFDALEEVYNSYKSNQPLQAENISSRFGQMLPTEVNTIGYPMASIAFLEDLHEKVRIIIMPTLKMTTSYEPKEFCAVTPPFKVDKFCKEHGLERALKAYIKVTCRIFKDASEITMILSEDPEIENYIKVCFNIKIKADIPSLLAMDKECFRAIDSIIPDNERDFFVKTYEIIE
jgi:hypothetical protein